MDYSYRYGSRSAGLPSPWPIRAPRGNTRTAKGWLQEAAKRMLMNNLDPEVAEHPEDLVVYGGTGRAARDWRSFDAMVRTLTDLRSVSVLNNNFNAIFGSGKLFGVPSLVIWTVAIVGIGYFFYRQTKFGAHVHAAGDNRQAALVSGIRVQRIRTWVLVISSTSAALAGILYAGRLQAARYTLGEADMMTVIAAVIVGGTRLFGGKGSIMGALVGSLLMAMLNNGLILMGLSVSQQMIVRGAIILLAVALTLREKTGR